ncbi:hypothetical protein ABIB94_005612 [Bradyrhizobium sp. JR7.2]|jgi:hypothetical protein
MVGERGAGATWGSELLFVARMFFALMRELRRGRAHRQRAVHASLRVRSGSKALRGAVDADDERPRHAGDGGPAKARLVLTRMMRAVNGLMFRALNAVITICRAAERLLLSYPGMRRNKIRFIPTRATLPE